MSFSQRMLVALSHGVTRAVFRIHAEELARVPASGPLIIVMNHINILEIPLIYARLQPRQVYGLVLADRWKNPLLAWGLDACGAIPLERGGINLSAINRAVEVLKAGKMVLIMPEGTRSGNGRLQKAYPGVALLAMKSQAPLLPIVTFGGEKYRANLKKLRRTEITIRVGEPFLLETTGGIPGSQARQQMVEEIMRRMAALLPDEYRGVYAGLSE
jgi:1-acyl-sn-glycerol-3-phosphate acyltransferase